MNLTKKSFIIMTTGLILTGSATAQENNINPSVKKAVLAIDAKIKKLETLKNCIIEANYKRDVKACKTEFNKK